MDLAGQMIKAADEIAASDEEIVTALRRLGPAFYEAAQNVASTYQIPAPVASLFFLEMLRASLSSVGLTQLR